MYTKYAIYFIYYCVRINLNLSLRCEENIDRILLLFDFKFNTSQAN